MIELFPQNVYYEFRVPYQYQGNRPRPLITISVRFGQASLDLLALVDSGADLTTFSSEIAKALGINLNRLPLSTSRGISGTTRSWHGRLDLTVSNLQFPNCPVIFIDHPDCPPLLGREPVFEKLQIGFRQSAWEWYFTPSP